MTCADAGRVVAVQKAPLVKYFLQIKKNALGWIADNDNRRFKMKNKEGFNRFFNP